MLTLIYIRLEQPSCILANSDFPKCSSSWDFRADASAVFSLLWSSHPVIPVTKFKYGEYQPSLIYIENDYIYDFGHFGSNSSQSFLVIIHPSPGKKSLRYKISLPCCTSTKLAFPLSFQAETHQRVGSLMRSWYVVEKYEKKSGATSKSSVMLRKKISIVLNSHSIDYCTFDNNYSCIVKCAKHLT